MTDQWYNDINKYDFEKGTGEAGNFSQLVWLGTQEVGYGKARSDDGTRCIVVAHYYPPGNVIGHYLSNVRPPLQQEEPIKKRSILPLNLYLLVGLFESFALDIYLFYTYLHNLNVLTYK